MVIRNANQPSDTVSLNDYLGKENSQIVEMKVDEGAFSLSANEDKKTFQVRAGRILSFDDKAALIWARLMAEGKVAARPGSGLDMIVAAIAGANECMVVTDNEKDFAGIQFVNPMRGAA